MRLQAIASQVLHTVAQPTRVGSQEFTDNVCRRLGSQHDSGAEARIGSISLRCCVGASQVRCFLVAGGSAKRLKSHATTANLKNDTSANLRVVIATAMAMPDIEVRYRSNV